MFDTQSSARSKTPFGDFELHPTHLRTGVTRIGYQQEQVDADIARRAAVKVCSEAKDVDEARMLLDMLGLSEVHRG